MGERIERDTRRMVYDAIVQLMGTLGRTPTQTEIARFLGIRNCVVSDHRLQLFQDGVLEGIHGKGRATVITKINPYRARANRERTVTEPYATGQRILCDPGVIAVCLNCPYEDCIKERHGCREYKAAIAKAKSNLSPPPPHLT